MRGNPAVAGSAGLEQGSIPACAGEPRLLYSAISAAAVYPRVCGGTGHYYHQSRCPAGLSPRVRGNLFRWSLARRRDRSIPACAGEPYGNDSIPDGGRVYPRVCGGTVQRRRHQFPVQGLSPRVRGNLLVHQVNARAEGSIPACAGEPRLLGYDGSGNLVYPRVCGGTLPTGFHAPNAEGLSPRVRGNRLDIAAPTTVRRSIPACAGEPTLDGDGTADSPVYPRVCGGTPLPTRRRSKSRGLSPRVRGNRPAAGRDGHRQGSIPACAGEPCPTRMMRLSGGVYPRVCGGTMPLRRALTTTRGLSPRVRGNRSR